MVARGENGPVFRVGQRVKLNIGRRVSFGRLVEDRGSIGIGGRRLWSVELDDTEQPGRIEMPENELEPEPSPGKLNQREIGDYLARGGLVALLRTNQSGGPRAPRVWLTRDPADQVTYTFVAERGISGGVEAPPFALHGDDRIFRAKADEVVRFLAAFGLTRAEARTLVERVGIVP